MPPSDRLSAQNSSNSRTIVPLAIVVVLFIGLVLAIGGLRVYARATIAERGIEALASLGAQTQRLITIMEQNGFSLAEQSAELRQVRDSNHCDLLIILDPALRVINDTGRAEQGMQVSALMIDSVAISEVKRTQEMRTIRTTSPFGEPILHVYAPLSLAETAAVLFIQKHDYSEIIYADIDNISILAGLIGSVLILIMGYGLRRLIIQNQRTAQQQSIVDGLDHVGRVAAQIAHDVKNPLGTALIATQSLSCSEGLDEEDHKLLQAIERNIKRSSAEIEGMLDSVRNTPFKYAHTHINELVYLTAEELKNRAAQSGINLTVHTSDADPLSLVDPGRLRQCLANLIVNAIEACEEQGDQVIVRIIPDAIRSNYITIDIIDNGPGIAPHIRSQLFKPFTTTKKNGTGLGLAGSRKAVEGMGGSLTLLEQPQGVCFRIQLPVSEAQ